MVQAVEGVLREIGAGELPIELVLNKIDRLDGEARERVGNRFPSSLQVSAQTGEGLDALRGRIAELFEGRFQVVELLVPYERGDVVSSLYALGPPIELREDRADGVFIRARLPERELRRLAPFLVRDAVAATAP